MGSTDPQICFEGLLVKVAANRKSRNTQNLWCTLDGECLAFYRNKRSSCMFTIEINRVKSVVPFLDKNQFEIVTEKSFLFSAENEQLCQEWINHIEEARQQGGQLVLTSHKQEDPQQVSPRRGSLPQHNTVSNALKRLSGKSEKGEDEPNTTKPLDTQTDRKSTTKDMISRFSTGVLPKETECSPSRPSRPTSGGNVNTLLLRFSSEVSNQSSTSPVSLSPGSPVRPFSPKSERPTSSSIPEQQTSSISTARPSSVANHQTNQEMQGITTTSTGTKIDLSEVSRVPSHDETRNSGDSCTDSGYTSGICGSPPKESPEKVDQHTVNGQDICDGKNSSPDEELEEPAEVDDTEDEVQLRRTNTVDNEDEVGMEEEKEDENDGPDLQLLDDLMSLTFEEVEVPQSEPVDLSVITELKGMLTDLPPSLLLRRSVDVNNPTPIEELRQFLQTAQ